MWGNPTVKVEISMLINEVARIAEMSKDGIRHYEEMGLIGSSPVRAGSRIYRDYDPSVLKTIERIKQAQQLGLSLKELGPLLEAFGEREISNEETVAFLKERRQVIRKKITELRKIESFIDDKIKRYITANETSGEAA